MAEAATRIDCAFLHGGGQGGWVWDATIAALRAQAGNAVGATLALDVPGCGTKRGRATGGIDNVSIARELVADIEQAGLRDVILVGHSQAGQVMPIMAGLRPGLFRRLIYVACSIPEPGQTVVALVGSGRQGADAETIGFPFDPATTPAADRYPLMFCNDMTAMQADAFLARLGEDRWPMASYAFTDWGQARCDAVPASYVVCLRDRILPVVWQERFAGRFRADRIVRIDAGHQAMTTRPHMLAEIVRGEARA